MTKASFEAFGTLVYCFRGADGHGRATVETIIADHAITETENSHETGLPAVLTMIAVVVPASRLAPLAAMRNNPRNVPPKRNSMFSRPPIARFP